MSNKRKNNEAMPAISVRLRQEQIDECERLYKKLGLESRNDFIRDAIDFYCEYLRCPESVKFLTPALESVISAKIRDTESRLSNIQFKNAVAIEKLYLLLGDEYEKSEDELDEYREAAVRNVKQTNGLSRY